MLAAILAFATTIGSAQPSSGLPTGPWITADRSAVLDFRDCAGRPCATLVWAREGLPGRDENNRDRRLRQRGLCNLAIVGGLSSGGEGTWIGGWLYDPESGETYNLRLTTGRTSLSLFIMDEQQHVLRAETLRPAPKHQGCVRSP